MELEHGYEKVEVTTDEELQFNQIYEIHYKLSYVPKFLHNTIANIIKSYADSYFWIVHDYKIDTEKKELILWAEKEKILGTEDLLDEESLFAYHSAEVAISAITAKTVYSAVGAFATILVLIVGVSAVYKIVKVTKENPILGNLLGIGAVGIILYSVVSKFFPKKGG